MLSPVSWKYLVHISIRNIRDRDEKQSGVIVKPIEVDFRSCSWSWFCWKNHSCDFTYFIFVSCCNIAWPPLWTVGLSSWPWKSGDIGWTGLKMHSWFGQIIATWSTSNKTNVDSLLGSTGSFLWPVLLSGTKKNPVAFSRQSPSLVGSSMSVPSFMRPFH